MLLGLERELVMALVSDQVEPCASIEITVGEPNATDACRRFRAGSASAVVSDQFDGAEGVAVELAALGAGAN
ncbi:MAG: hypothetical protein ACI9C1_000589 [Candidatus Aldehydirespiratoraceae bacterium]